MPVFLCNKGQTTFPVKGSIIHNDDGIRGKVYTKTIFKPLLKKLAVHSSFVLQRRYDFVAEFGCHYTHALISFARYAPDYFRASFRISIFSLKICINTRFIHVSNAIGGYLCYLFKIFQNLLWALLLKTLYLFLRVISRRFKLLHTVDMLQPKCSANSDKYGSGVASR